MTELPPGFMLDQPDSLPAGFTLDAAQDPEIPTPTPPAELAARAQERENRPLLEKIGENIRQNTMMGGATDWRNVIAAAPPSMSVAGVTGAGQGAVGAVNKELLRRTTGYAPSARAMTRAAGQAAGYVVPASQSGRASIVGRIIEPFVGKENLQQAGTLRNQDVSTRLAGEALGLKGETFLTPGRLEKIREPAYEMYEKIKSLPGRFTADRKFIEEIDKMRRPFAAASKDFPQAKIVPEAEEIAMSLLQNEGAAGYTVQSLDASARGIMERVEALRASAKQGFKAIGNPEAKARASAEWQAAKALENLMERNLAQSGNRGVYEGFRNARELLAKTEDVSRALVEGAGEISASAIARIGKKGYMTDNLALIKQFHEAFPKVTQSASQVGARSLFNMSDVVAGAVGNAAFGTAGIAAGVARPIARNILGDLALKGQPMPKALQLQGIVQAIRAAQGGGQNMYDAWSNYAESP